MNPLTVSVTYRQWCCHFLKNNLLSHKLTRDDYIPVSHELIFLLLFQALNVAKISSAGIICVIIIAEGAEIVQWLERGTRDQKVVGSNPCRSGGENFLIQGQLSVLTLISVSVPPLLPQ